MLDRIPPVTIPNLFNITMMDSFFGGKNSFVDTVIILETEYTTDQEFNCAKALFAELGYIFIKINPIGLTGAFIGVVTYNETTHLQMPLRKATTYQELILGGLPSYTLSASQTNTKVDGSLALANAMLNKAGRSGALKKVWLFLSNTSSTNPLPIAQAMKNNKTEIYVFAVYDNVDPVKLNGIASSGNVMWFSKYCVLPQKYIFDSYATTTTSLSPTSTPVPPG
ncbi:uncharacterized protein LOC135923742 isoform X2 [Gordionus sp. m RMFG-2023]|uniref:uncharacterized protein LOC135923742 isoform X2 n=1 Tax=Gordionus sp. m RMFG-2023 TaxID=3053472 RepID=UPI0031FDCF7F